MPEVTKIAVVQAPPVVLQRRATIERVREYISEGSSQGASLIVFPEAYVPGYPTWAWRLRPGGDGALSGEVHARIRENSVNLIRGDLQPRPGRGALAQCDRGSRHQ
jgi:nitrilase